MRKKNMQWHLIAREMLRVFFSSSWGNWDLLIPRYHPLMLNLTAHPSRHKSAEAHRKSRTAVLEGHHTNTIY